MKHKSMLQNVHTYESFAKIIYDKGLCTIDIDNFNKVDNYLLGGVLDI